MDGEKTQDKMKPPEPDKDVSDMLYRIACKLDGLGQLMTGYNCEAVLGENAYAGIGFMLEQLADQIRGVEENIGV